MADNKLMSMTEIFNEKLFRIPDFQRGYSWEPKHLEAFWDDLNNLSDDRTHYTGLLTVEPISKDMIRKVERWQDDLWLIENGLSAYYIIDGQQRLTTLIILVNEILNRFDDSEGICFKYKKDWTSKFLYQCFGDTYKSYIFGYEKDNPSDEYFKTKILNQESSSADKVPEQTLYTYNLKMAKTFFKDKINGLTKEELENTFRKSVNRFKFNFYEIDDDLDVYITFETMNNRGKLLSNLELLKNRLIYLTTLLDGEIEKERLRKDINEAWKTIYEYLGKNNKNQLDDDEFLMNHWIMYFKYDRKESGSYSKFLLNERFTAKNIRAGKVKLTDIKRYIDSLAKCVKSWFYIYNPERSSYPDYIKEWLQKLNRVGFGAFPPLLMAALSKEDDNKKLDELLKASERFVFLVFGLTRRPSNTKNSHFYRLANSYYFGVNNTTITSVIADIQLNTDGQIVEGGESVYQGWFDLDKFKIYIGDQYTDEEGYYSWSGIRYFLYEYELYLQGKANGNEKVTWQDYNKRKKEDTIEHIYPQKPKDSKWIEEFKSASKKHKKYLLHNLGNLLLLANSKNAELQNNHFEFKKKHKNKNGEQTGYFNGSYSEIEVAGYKKWTPTEILDRGIRMLNFMQKRWAINFDDWDTSSIELLKLEFVQDEAD